VLEISSLEAYLLEGRMRAPRKVVGGLFVRGLFARGPFVRGLFYQRAISWRIVCQRAIY